MWGSARRTSHSDGFMGKKKQRTEHRKEIVFDENARREFITGFRKRKKERRLAEQAQRSSN